MGDWFAMVHEKNGLVRWAQELAVRARELELEDRHVRLQHELKHRMALPGGSIANFVSLFGQIVQVREYNQFNDNRFK